MKLTQKIVEPFIATLEEALPYKVTITNLEGYIIGSSDPTRINMFHPSAYEILCGRQPIESWDINLGVYVNIPSGTYLGYGEKIIFEGECIGLIGLIGNPEEIKSSMKTAQLVLHLLLERKRTSDEIKLVSTDKHAFIQQLLRGQAGTERWLEERARMYGITLDIPRFALVLQPDMSTFADMRPLELSRMKKRILNTVLDRFSGPEDMVYDFDTGEVAILTACGGYRDAARREKVLEKAVTQLYDEIKEKFSIPLLIGVSEECAEQTGFAASYEMANTAARIGRRTKGKDGIYFYSQIRLGRIVAGFSPEIRPVLDSVIEELMNCGDKTLFETLSVYFEQNGNVTETAQHLFIHRNTLQYRFKQIRELTGYNIYNIDDLVQLRLAVLQYKYFNEE